MAEEKEEDNIELGPLIEISISTSSDTELLVHDIQPKHLVDNLHDEVKADETKPNIGSPPEIKRQRIFHVTETLLTKNDFSPVLAAKFRGRRRGDDPQESSLVENVDAFELLLRERHGNPDERHKTLKISTVWQVFVVADYYRIQLKPMKRWFEAWYKANKSPTAKVEEQLGFASQIFFPASWFDHAEAFATTTKFLMYNGVSHIGHHSPVPIDHAMLQQGINRE